MASIVKGGEEGGSAAVGPIEARRAVRAYKGEAAGRKDAFALTILNRLEADTDGRISAALTNLKPVHTSLIIFYLIQAADLTKSRFKVVSETKALAEEYRQAAQRAQKLLAFCRGKMPSWTVLPKLAEELNEQAQWYDASIKKLQIGRKVKGENDEKLLAIRHFTKRLQDEFGIDCSCALPRDLRQRLQRSIQHLLEAALNCQIPAHLTAEAIRSLKISGIQEQEKRPNS